MTFFFFPQDLMAQVFSEAAATSAAAGHGDVPQDLMAQVFGEAAATSAAAGHGDDSPAPGDEAAEPSEAAARRAYRRPQLD